jgi:hypothetical protein
MAADKPWFRPKRFGYGAGLPLCWQGWALMLSPVIVAVPLGFLSAQLWGATYRAPVTIISLLVLLLPVMLIARAKTEGGWRWRWGDDT